MRNSEKKLTPDDPAIEVELSVAQDFLKHLTPEAQILFRDGIGWNSRQLLGLVALRGQIADKALAHRIESPTPVHDKQ